MTQSNFPHASENVETSTSICTCVNENKNPTTRSMTKRPQRYLWRVIEREITKRKKHQLSVALGGAISTDSVDAIVSPCASVDSGIDLSFDTLHDRSSKICSSCSAGSQSGCAHVAQMENNDIGFLPSSKICDDADGFLTNNYILPDNDMDIFKKQCLGECDGLAVALCDSRIKDVSQYVKDLEKLLDLRCTHHYERHERALHTPMLNAVPSSTNTVPSSGSALTSSALSTSPCNTSLNVVSVPFDEPIDIVLEQEDCTTRAGNVKTDRLSASFNTDHCCDSSSHNWPKGPCDISNQNVEFEQNAACSELLPVNKSNLDLVSFCPQKYSENLSLLKPYDERFRASGTMNSDFRDERNVISGNIHSVDSAVKSVPGSFSAENATNEVGNAATMSTTPFHVENWFGSSSGDEDVEDGTDSDFEEVVDMDAMFLCSFDLDRITEEFTMHTSTSPRTSICEIPCVNEYQPDNLREKCDSPADHTVLGQSDSADLGSTGCMSIIDSLELNENTAVPVFQTCSKQLQAVRSPFAHGEENQLGCNDVLQHVAELQLRETTVEAGLSSIKQYTCSDESDVLQDRSSVTSSRSTVCNFLRDWADRYSTSDFSYLESPPKNSDTEQFHIRPDMSQSEYIWNMEDHEPRSLANYFKESLMSACDSRISDTSGTEKVLYCWRKLRKNPKRIWKNATPKFSRSSRELGSASLNLLRRKCSSVLETFRQKLKDNDSFSQCDQDMVSLLDAWQS